jgi:anaerobic carbon-monoxide dehydrogenase catalytic subunit
MSQKKSYDNVTNELIDLACEKGVSIAWDRLEEQSPQCGFGTMGVCCRICAMGPCQTDPYGHGPQRGVCGADSNTIAARNFIRMIASGAAAHSDHGRAVAETFIEVAKGNAPGYSIQDEQKLLALAMDFGVEIGERGISEIALEVGELSLAQWGQQQGELVMCKRAPIKRQQVWRDLDIMPRGIDREIVEIMHRTHMGVDQEYKHLINHGSRASLGDGWGGSMLATELQDIMFGTPVPSVGSVNLGLLEPKQVNIILHGHEPLLSEMIVAVSMTDEMKDYAKSKGAEGINLAGICCTANEILMRHSIPMAGNFLQQEVAILTGMVEAMVVDVQCIMQSLPEIASGYHTEIITTSRIARMPGAKHIEFHEDKAVDSATEIVKAACDNFVNRKAEDINLVKGSTDMVVGFSHETINYLLGGSFRASYRPLNDNIINGKIRGIGAVVGCNNPKAIHDQYHIDMVKELIANDVIVLTTGCAAGSLAKEGLLDPIVGGAMAGEGLREVCETVGIPPVLHMGSCVDNSRILMAASAVVKEGGLGDDLCDVPAAGAAPEWMSEKAISIGQYFVASGVYVVFGTTWPTHGAPELTKYLFEGIEEDTGGRWGFEPDPVKAAQLMIAHIDEKRKALGIDKKKERVLMDMEMRRAEAEVEA